MNWYKKQKSPRSATGPSPRNPTSGTRTVIEGCEFKDCSNVSATTTVSGPTDGFHEKVHRNNKVIYNSNSGIAIYTTTL